MAVEAALEPNTSGVGATSVVTREPSGVDGDVSLQGNTVPTDDGGGCVVGVAFAISTFDIITRWHCMCKCGSIWQQTHRIADRAKSSPMGAAMDILPSDSRQ